MYSLFRLSHVIFVAFDAVIDIEFYYIFIFGMSVPDMKSGNNGNDE